MPTKKKTVKFEIKKRRSPLAKEPAAKKPWKRLTGAVLKKILDKIKEPKKTKKPSLYEYKVPPSGRKIKVYSEYGAWLALASAWRDNFNDFTYSATVKATNGHTAACTGLCSAIRGLCDEASISAEVKVAMSNKIKDERQRKKRVCSYLWDFEDNLGRVEFCERMAKSLCK